MSNQSENPKVLPGCSVMSPMESPAPHPASKPTGKVARNAKQKATTGDRFQVLNAFVDHSLSGLSKSESGAWMVLYRDTKPDGTVRTSMADMAQRVGVDRRSIVTA